MENIRKTPSLEAIILQHYLLISRMALATTLIVITILALLPINSFRGIELTFWRLPIAADKMAHLMAFMVISGFMDGFQYQNTFNLKKAAIAAIYGIYIEGLQSLTDYRHPSFWDIVANCVGIFMYWALIPLWKITPVLRIRWKYKHKENRLSKTMNIH